MAVSKFVLQKINSGVWFVQTFLQKMLYIAKPPNFPYTSSVVNMWKMKKERRLGSIGEGEGEIVRQRRDRAALELDWCDQRSSAIVGLVRSSIWCDRWTGVIIDLVRKSLFFLSLSLSYDCRTSATSTIFLLLLSLSLSLFYFPRPEVI